MNPMRQFLLVDSSQAENAFALFTQEILKSEGLNGFQIHDLAAAPLPDFGDGDLAILTRCFLSRGARGRLVGAVENGLRLVCLQPSWNLAQELGWKPVKRILHPGWIDVEGESGLPGGGETLQTHVPIALYESDNEREYSQLARAVADFRESGKSGEHPAIARQKIGEGEVVCFFYDVAKAIARLRFGDPERASLLNNGHWAWTHAFDMQLGYADERVLHLPQAELHAQLLAHALTEICPYPLARLWYYEKAEQRAAANVSSDDDWSAPEDFTALSESLLRNGGRGTFYLMNDTRLPEAQMRALREAGHSFGVHINATALPNEDEDWNIIFPRCLREQTEAFRARYHLAPSLSMQCHYAPWLGFMEFVPLFMASGYRLIFNFMNHSKDLNLYGAGAGRPLKFANETGKVFDCWQQPMQTYDDASIKVRLAAEPDAVFEDFLKFLRPCLERFHSAIGLGSHPIAFTAFSAPFLDRVFAKLHSENIPIYSADDWCRFSDRRHAIEARPFNRDGASGVQLKNVEGAFTMMFPLRENAEIEAFIDGAPAASTRINRLGRDHLCVEVSGDCEITLKAAKS